MFDKYNQLMQGGKSNIIEIDCNYKYFNFLRGLEYSQQEIENGGNGDNHAAYRSNLTMTIKPSIQDIKDILPAMEVATKRWGETVIVCSECTDEVFEVLRINAERSTMGSILIKIQEPPSISRKIYRQLQKRSGISNKAKGASALGNCHIDIGLISSEKCVFEKKRV